MHDSAVRKVDQRAIDFTRGMETARPLGAGRFTVRDVKP
jgi:hypothetical protein